MIIFHQHRTYSIRELTKTLGSLSEAIQFAIYWNAKIV